MPCTKCKHPTNSEERIMKCGLCDSVFHILCIGMSVTTFNSLNKMKNVHWFCDNCNQDNVLTELKELKNLKKQISELNKKFEILSSKVNSCTNDVNRRSENMNRDNIVEIIREEREIEKRQNNLCIFNLPESSDDQQSFKDICVQQLGLDEGECVITDTVRVGQSQDNKPKILIVKLASRECRNKILRNAPKLRNYSPANSNYKIYVSPDYTRKQREFQKDLRQKLKERRENGEQVVIRRGEIVQVSRNVPSQ